MKKVLALSLLIIFSQIIALSQTGLSNELIWTGREFSGDAFGGMTSMKDGLHYSALENSDAFGSKIVKYSYATGKEVGVIATSVDVFGSASTSIDGYEFSADEKQILIQTETEGIYRYSFKANYYIFKTETKTTFPLTDFTQGKQMLADFSPNGKHIAFVRSNNLFVLDTGNKKEIQITTDGEFNKIINGSTDWVYEEEFAIYKGFYWSPAGDRIAYYRFDESAVKEFSMDMFGGLYPEQYKFKYPKAGEDNSVVSIHVWDITSNKSTPVNIGTNTDQYIPRIMWTQDNNQLCVMRMNRHQNKLEFLLANVSAPSPFSIDTKVLYSEQAETYIDINDALTFLKDGSFIWLSERNDYNHLYHFDATGQIKQPLTSGNWDVIDFYGFDESTMTAYYSSSEISSMEKHVYSASFKKKKTNCCKLSVAKGNNDAMFSSGFKYYIMMHSDANTPMDITLYDNEGMVIRVLADNAALKERLVKYNLAKKEFFTFKNATGDDLNCWMMKPTNFDPTKKYPVLVAIYGGPGSNTVNDAWGGRNHLWHEMLCQMGYIVVSCDPRGTQYRGRKFKHSTYMNLGKLETEDFIDFAKYLGGQSYIDKARIGIQGWSYGGYMTSLCMTKGADVYTAGIAVAPVTNWKYYDSIYTERFLRTPQENSGGYENNSPINFVDGLKGKFLLVHGSADDNVHYQNSMDMISALVNANKQFELFIYPNKNHGIYGGNTRLHLYTKLTNFLKENL
ncbi:MAG: S9 family peptidase [Flavobacteriales bacterium]